MDQLEEIRRKIDECDQIMIKTFEERMKAVTDILKYKRQQGLPIYDFNREAMVVNHALQNLESNQYQEEAKDLIETIIKISRKMQSKLLIPFNLVLIGFMGTGKTSIGKVLANLLDKPLIDLDLVMEEKIGMSISRFFQEDGEAAFRQMEKEVVKEESRKSNQIISCGGGVVLLEENMVNLRATGKVILLTAKADTIYNRLKENDTRPLLKDIKGPEEIQMLLDRRESLYRNAADMTISTDGKSLDTIASEIIGNLLGVFE